jgi:nodulation protein E
MSSRRVAVTGIGVVCALGRGKAEFWQHLIRGDSGISDIQSVDTSKLRFHTGAEARGFDPAQHFEPNKKLLLDRFAQFAVVAAREAVADARLLITPKHSCQIGVLVGSSVGGQSSQDHEFEELYARGRGRVHPLTIPRVMMNAGASHICMNLGITGPSMVISTACSSSNHAIGQAFWMVRSGQIDVAIAGGSEAPFSFGLLKAWEAMRVVSAEKCRPFSKNRSGLILGEGGAMLVLESREQAVKRGATIYAEIVGFGASADAYHITQAALAGPAQAIRAALADGGIDATRVGYINAHGTGTISNDPVESRAIREVFGESTDSLLVSSTKSMHGHALGAAGAIEAVATVLALQNQLIPPTINFTENDPECAVNLVANESRSARIDYALSNSFAFGGLNASLAFRRA